MTLYSSTIRLFFTHVLLAAAMISGFIEAGSDVKTPTHRIIYCMCNPRSALIELLRMVGERGDFKVMHIPGNWAYCHAHNYTELTKGWYREDAPAIYEQTLADILKEAETADVFVGENTHTAKDFFEVNKDFLKDPRLEMIFLVSDPHASIISYYEKKQSYFDSMPASQMSDSLGLKGMYELGEKIKEQTGNRPFTIKSEDLYFKTQEMVSTLCKYLHIPFIEKALRWKDASASFSSFTDLGWYTIELTDCSKTWHGNAIKSTCFSRPVTYAVDAHGNPTFEEISNPKHREICQRAYEENIGYYNLLLEKTNTNPRRGISHD